MKFFQLQNFASLRISPRTLALHLSGQQLLLVQTLLLLVQTIQVFRYREDASAAQELGYGWTMIEEDVVHSLQILDKFSA